MKSIQIFSKILYPSFWHKTVGRKDSQTFFNYRRIWCVVVLGTVAVSILPLLMFAIMNLNQYQKAMHAEMVYPAFQLVSNVKQDITFFMGERRSLLTFLAENNSFVQLTDQRHLAELFVHIKKLFRGFIDLGVIDGNGVPRTYVGPYSLRGRNYHDQDWFQEVSLHGVYISDVFKGVRDVPRFIMAVKHQQDDGSFFILRASIDAARFYDLIQQLDIPPGWDAFIINNKGILQTSSRCRGDALRPIGIAVPQYSAHTKIVQAGNNITGYAYIPNTPFVFMLLCKQAGFVDGWEELRGETLSILFVSVVGILFVVLGVVTFLVNRIYLADKMRAAALRGIEQSEKMASIGRLAAGVAHEINNPLAIINEKSGLIKDLLRYSKDYKKDDRLISLVDSVLQSVERCSTITHRLLGFARHVDVRIESLNLKILMEEVLGFLRKETEYRDIHIGFHADKDLPEIQSDRGQLQQVFFNIINNAFAAVDDGGSITIDFQKFGQDKVIVSIRDSGKGISQEDIKRIFEPFFSTKTGQGGTGLGLFITYGLVQKLGGTIHVESELGKGTTFVVILPRKQ